MKRKYILILCLILLSFASCHKSADFVSAEYTISISDKDLGKSYKASDIFEKVDFVFLETNDNCLMGNAGKTLITEDRIVMQSGKSIFMFDRSGSFIKRINRQGHGAGEYVELNDYALMSNGTILLLDTQMKKMIVLDRNGNLLYDQKLPFYAYAVECLNDSVLAFAGSGREDRVIIWDVQKQKKINSFLPYNHKYSVTIFTPFVKFGTNVYFRHAYLSGLYKIEESTLYYEWHIDFGRRTITEKEMVGVVPNGYTMEMFFNSPHTAELTRFWEIKEQCFFTFQCEELSDGDPYFVFYSKKTDKKIVLDYSFIDDMSFFFIAPPIIRTTTPEGKFATVLNPGLWLAEIEKHKAQIEEYHLQSAYTDFQMRTKQMSDLSNPVVVIYTLKDF